MEKVTICRTETYYFEIEVESKEKAIEMIENDDETLYDEAGIFDQSFFSIGD